jgi:TetR/AcrR family transcriptional regulator, copper-responsive repressor
MGRPKKFSREKVLDKAIPVFWKHGFAQTSVQDLEQATGVNKSSLYAEFENKDDLFIAILQRYLEVLRERGTLTKQPLGWSNIEAFVKLCYGSWGQKGCFSVNSMREFSDLPPRARALMTGSVIGIRRDLIRNLAAARGKSRDNDDALAGLVITFFPGYAWSRISTRRRSRLHKRLHTSCCKFVRCNRWRGVASQGRVGEAHESRKPTYF